MSRLAAIFLVVAVLAAASPPAGAYPVAMSPNELAWEAAFPPEPDDINRHAGGAALDAGGNLYVTGYVEDTDGNFDALLVKYSPQGELLWSRRYDYSWYDIGFAAATDPKGNVLVAGASHNMDRPGDAFLSVYNTDYVALKYTTDGTLVFDAPAPGYYKNNIPSGIASGPDGAIYVTGTAKVPSNAYGVYYTVSFDQKGRIVRERPDDWGIDAEASGIALDGDGNVTVTGSRVDPETERYYVRTITLTPDLTHALADVSYRPVDKDDEVRAAGIAALPGGGYVITGTTTEADGTTFTAYYGPDGLIKWNSLYPGLDAQNSPAAVCADKFGRAYVLVNPHGGPKGDRRNAEPVLLVYGRDGSMVSETTLDLGGDNSEGTSLAAGDDGSVTVAGTTIVSNGRATVRVLRLKGNGQPGVAAGPPGAPAQGTAAEQSAELSAVRVDTGTGPAGIAFYARAAEQGEYEYRFYVSTERPGVWKPMTDYISQNYWFAPDSLLMDVDKVMVQVRSAGSFMGFDAKGEIDVPRPAAVEDVPAGEKATE